MTTPRESLVIRTDQNVATARVAFRRFWQRCRDTGQAMRMTIEVFEPPRNVDQNALLHAALTDISRQCEWAGRKWPMEEWKALMVSAHAQVEERPAQVVAGLEGELVAIRESTARMSKRRMSSLIDYVLAWGSTNDVEWSKPGEVDEWRQEREAA